MDASIWFAIGAFAGADFAAGMGTGMGACDVAYLAAIIGAGLMLQRLGSRWARFPLAIGQLWLFCQFGGLLTYAVMGATPPHPLADATLARWDAALGFDWMAWHHTVTPIRPLLHYAYNSVPVQVPVLLALACWRREPGRIDDLIMATILSVILVTVGMWFLPAIGAWSHFGIGIEPWRDTILALRAGTIGAVGDTVGIVTFPSFHAACAVLLAWTARGWRGWFPVFVILDAVMALSAMTEGAHYGVDVVAGLVTAGVAIALVWAMRSMRPLLAAGMVAGWRPRPAVTT